MKKESLNDRVLKFVVQQEAAGVFPHGGGIAIAVIKNGDVLLNKGYGLRDRERNLPVTSETVFETCSLTKGFTSAALMMALEKKKIDLRQPINASKNVLTLNDPAISEKVSIMDILSHRTGLPAYDLVWYWGSLNREEFLRTVANLPLVTAAFRNTFLYSNLLYGAIGHLFEEIVGESWESSISRKIFKPLRMNSSSFQPSSHETNTAIPYIGTAPTNRIDTTSIAAAGGIRSSLEDMTRWLAFLLNEGKTLGGEQLLSKSSVQLTQEKQIAAENANPLFFQGLEWLCQKDVGYGLGWFLGSINGMKAIFQPGLVDGFSAALVMIPEAKTGIVVLTNLNLSPVPGLLIQDLLNSLLEHDDSAHKVAPPTQNPSWVGKYENAAFGEVSIFEKGKDLILEYRNHEWILNQKDNKSAEFVMTGFGLQIPISVRFEIKENLVTQLSFPLSLDPTLAPQTFVRI